MFVIKNKPKSPKIVWDAQKNKPLFTFDGGLFATEDAYIAERAKKLGYEVEAEQTKEAEPKATKGKKKASEE